MTTKFSYSQALLAVAIAYFAYALLSFTKQVPHFINAVNNTTPYIDTIVNEVSLVRAEVTQVRTVVDTQLPTLLSRIDNTLPLLERGLSQSDYYAQQLPQLWQHLTKLEAKITQIQQMLPSLLTRVDDVVLMTNATTNELAKWRPHSTEYLDEIAQSREYIPQYLTRIEYIISDAKTMGKEASSGLVSGFFKGVISLPFEVVSGLTGIVDSDSKSAKLLTAADVSILQKQTITLLEDTTKNTMLWQNAQSGNQGKIVQGKKLIKKGLTCHNMTFINNLKGQQETLKELMCEDNKGLWQVM